MSRFAVLALAATVLTLSATPAPAQVYPLTNGPNGGQSNTIDSARGWAGINSVAPERELLYRPERGGNVAAGASAEPLARDDVAQPEGMPRRARHHSSRARLR